MAQAAGPGDYADAAMPRAIIAGIRVIHTGDDCEDQDTNLTPAVAVPEDRERDQR